MTLKRRSEALKRKAVYRSTVECTGLMVSSCSSHRARRRKLMEAARTRQAPSSRSWARANRSARRACSKVGEGGEAAARHTHAEALAAGARRCTGERYSERRGQERTAGTAGGHAPARANTSAYVRSSRNASAKSRRQK